MPLNDKKLQKVNEWFKSKNVKVVCQSCGHNEWTASDIVVAPKFEKGIVLGGETVPMLQLVCKYCGNIRLYAAVPMGLMQEEPQEQNREESEEGSLRRRQ